MKLLVGAGAFQDFLGFRAPSVQADFRKSEGARGLKEFVDRAGKRQGQQFAHLFQSELRGEGDAKAAEIYANAYTVDAEFFAFYRSLNAYKNVFNKPNNMIVVEPTSDFFKYFKNQKTGQ